MTSLAKLLVLVGSVVALAFGLAALINRPGINRCRPLIQQAVTREDSVALVVLRGCRIGGIAVRFR